MRARILAVAVLSTGCYAQGTCEYKTVDYCQDGDMPADGGVQCTGRLFDPYTWESNPIDTGWLPYPGQREWIMHLHDKNGSALAGQILKIDAYVASNSFGSDGTLAGGNLTEFRKIGDDLIGIRNDSCADYYVRVVVTSKPLPGTDAGADASTDAATEASMDGSSE